MPSRDFTLLAAYSRIEPFGTKRDDWHHSKTQALIANSLNTVLYAFGRTKSRKTYSPTDFSLKRKKPTTQRIREFNAELRALSKQAK